MSGKGNGKIISPDLKAVLLDAALGYAAMGWSVFPCGPRNKRPLVKWRDQATTDPQMIRDWWSTWPAANLAIVTGQVSGIYVIDIDGPEGIEAFDQLQAQEGILPDTPAALTGGGGEHYFFAIPEGSWPNTAARIAQKIDTRGDGGYVIAPPSIHPKGTEYRWMGGRSPDLVSLAPLPGWICDLLIGDKNRFPNPVRVDGQDSGDYWLSKALEQATIGTRNDVGLWLACQLRDARLSLSEAEGIMSEYARKVPQNGNAYQEREAILTARSAYSRSARDPAKGNGKNGPEVAKRAFEDYLSYLDPEMRDGLRKANERIIARHLKGPNPVLEGLLTPLKTIDSAVILKTEYPPIPWIVEDYLPAGLGFLYGKPKLGKSWMGLQLADAVTFGGKVFDKNVEAGSVLYIALEDNERRLQLRMKKQKWPSTESVKFLMPDEFRERIGTLNSAGGKRLLSYIEAKEFRLVVVDTFSRAVQGDQLKSDEMTQAISPIQQYALANDVAIVIIDHEPKGGDSLFGSIAKFGILDTSWRLYKEQGKSGAKLDITGRDVFDQSLKLDFDYEHGFWVYLGEAYDVEMTDRRKEILEALKALGRCQLNDLESFTGQDRRNLWRRVQDLIEAGLIKQIGISGNTYFEAEIDV